MIYLEENEKLIPSIDEKRKELHKNIQDRYDNLVSSMKDVNVKVKKINDKLDSLVERTNVILEETK